MSALNLCAEAFAAAFPFHLAVDEDLRVLQVGAVLARLCPGMVVGCELGAHFVIRRPVLQRVDIALIRQHATSLFVIDQRDGPLCLRGQIVVQGPLTFFLGSPWVSEMADVVRIGLSFNDFAVHDPVVDLLFLLQTKNKALSDAQELSSRLRSSQQRLAQAQSLAKLGSWVLDPRTGNVEYSEEAGRIYGIDAMDAAPTLESLLARMPEDQRAGLRDAIVRAERTNAPVEFEHRVHAADGSDRWVHVNLQRAIEGGVSIVRAAARDETTRKNSALRLELAHNIAQQLATDIEPERAAAYVLSSIGAQLGWHAAVCWGLDESGQAGCLSRWSATGDKVAQDYIQALGGCCELWPGAPHDGAPSSVDISWRISWRTMPAPDSARARDRVAARHGMRSAVVVPVIAGAHRMALEFFSRAPMLIDGEVEGFLRSIARQLAQYLRRQQAESTLRHSACHDSLTGLANRTLLQERLLHAIQRAAREGKHVAVLFLDLDRFKHINDGLGHSAGDMVLRTCADRLRESVRKNDTVARFGGDEFVVVLEGLNSTADILAPLTLVMSRFRLPFSVNGRELSTAASIGISVYPENGRDAETLLMNADAAMYRAKEQGPGRYCFYSASMNAQGQERLSLESSLPRALERGELFLVYQPKMEIQTGAIIGVEALMRWRHPALGLISPLQFIPIAEEMGLIDSFGHWSLEVACRDARRWQDLGRPLQVSVNLSARQLDRPQLADEVAQVLADAGLPSACLELEITESGVMRNPAQAATRLRELRDLGVSLAIDDFGTGYSSLSYLRSFPLSTLKIDRSFINDLPADEDASALTAGTIALAHRLRMKVVAEGVETLEQLAFLRANGCDEIQGYFLSKPITAEEIDQFLARDVRHLVTPTAAA